jgi:uncharacterized protein YfaS (alpha-2-macroglobulin family)
MDLERQLRLKGDFKKLLQQRLNREVAGTEPGDPFVVREYSHQNVRMMQGNEVVRRDFTETLFWHPALVLHEGKAQVSFDLSDANTSFQVLLVGHAADGRLGAATFEIVSRLPASLDPKVPIEVTASDKIGIPIALKNDSDKQVSVRLRSTHKNLQQLAGGPAEDPRLDYFVNLDGGKSGRQVLHYKATIQEGTASLRVHGDFGPLGADVVERTFKIVPDGFPVIRSQSGLLEKVAVHEMELPANMVPGSLKAQVQVFPSTLAELERGLDSLLREPCGCFEQS